MTVRPWKPSPTKARKAASVEHVTLAQPESAPTPERQSKGMRRGPTVWRDDCQTPLHRARRYRHITERMFESGEEYIALRRAAMAVRGCASGRDSLDFTRYGASESGPEYAARIEQRDTKCGRVLGPLRGAAESFLIDEWQPQRGFDLKYVWWQDARAALIVLEVFFKGANA